VYIVGGTKVLGLPLISITTMITKSNRRSFKPFDELPSDFKNLFFNYLINTKPPDFQIASNSQYDLENLWLVIVIAGAKGISIPEAVSHLKRAAVVVPMAKTIWNNVEQDQLMKLPEKLPIH